MGLAARVAARYHLQKKASGGHVHGITFPTIGYGAEGCELTWQAPFPVVTACVHCGKPSRLAMVIKEGDEGYPPKWVTELHENEGADGGPFWLHDAAAFAIYLCTDIHCTEGHPTATTLWNQA